MVCMSKRLSSNIVHWDRIGVTNEVRNWITDGVPVHLKHNVEPFHISNPKFNKTEFSFIQREREGERE